MWIKIENVICVKLGSGDSIGTNTLTLHVTNNSSIPTTNYGP